MFEIMATYIKTWTKRIEIKISFLLQVYQWIFFQEENRSTEKKQQKPNFVDVVWKEHLIAIASSEA